MYRIVGDRQRLCSGWTRHDFLQVGVVGTLGLSLQGLLQAAEPSTTSGSSFGRAKNCILLFLTGGPPQHDTWDPKPDAPSEVRGEFRPIATSVAGIQISEMFPLLARQAHRYCLMRSVTHRDSTHTSAGYTMLTGVDHNTPNIAEASQVRPSAKDHPHLGSLLSLLKPSRAELPTFVSLPEIIKDAAVNEFPGQGGGFLGQRYDPFRIEANDERTQLIAPAISLPEGVTLERLHDRKALLRELDQQFAGAVAERRFGEIDSFYGRALDMVRSPAAQVALDLEREPAALRERYGEHLFGKGCLLARRLIESGVRLATVYWHYEGPDDSPVWDTHGNNFDHLRKRLMPPTDRAVSALLADLADRGLLDETLVICMGEFGRSPKINGQAGRDHWPGVQSIMLAGAGLPGGSVYGSSDKLGGAPATQPVTPADLFATLLHLLGVKHDTALTDLDGRVLPATNGTPLKDLL
jgi:hypothetical protein